MENAFGMSLLPLLPLGAGEGCLSCIISLDHLSHIKLVMEN